MNIRTLEKTLTVLAALAAIISASIMCKQLADASQGGQFQQQALLQQCLQNILKK